MHVVSTAPALNHGGFFGSSHRAFLSRRVIVMPKAHATQRRYRRSRSCQPQFPQPFKRLTDRILKKSTVWGKIQCPRIMARGSKPDQSCCTISPLQQRPPSPPGLQVATSLLLYHTLMDCASLITFHTKVTPAPRASRQGIPQLAHGRPPRHCHVHIKARTRRRPAIFCNPVVCSKTPAAISDPAVESSIWRAVAGSAPVVVRPMRRIR